MIYLKYAKLVVKNSTLTHTDNVIVVKQELKLVQYAEKILHIYVRLKDQRRKHVLEKMQINSLNKLENLSRPQLKKLVSTAANCLHLKQSLIDTAQVRTTRSV